MQKINELQQTKGDLIKFFDEMSARLKTNGIKVREAIAILETELREKNALRRD